MTTRRRNSATAALVALVVAIAPALTPAALVYDAKASGPDASARSILPDWDALDGGIDPVDGNLITRRAMEHLREGDDSSWSAWGLAALGAVCYWWSSAVCGVLAVAVLAYETYQLFGTCEVTLPDGRVVEQIDTVPGDKWGGC